MSHREIILVKGESVDLVLPSGTRLNLEVTEDEIDLIRGDRILFTESFNYGDLEGPLNQWDQYWPIPVL